MGKEQTTIWSLTDHVSDFRNEDTVHFFLECPTYDAPCAVLLTGLERINENLDTGSRRNKEILVNTFLNGNKELDYNINSEIFQLVQTFIASTSRFL